jgi:hypothetical protein
MYKKMISAGVLSSALMVSGSALAGGYGPAGCGVGTMLLGDDATGAMGGIAMYLNMAFYGPTSITMGTFGCGDGGVALLETEKLEFLGENRDQMEEETAKKTDATLLAFAELIQCSSEDAFVSAVQSDNNFFSGSNDELLTKFNVLALGTCTVAM